MLSRRWIRGWLLLSLLWWAALPLAAQTDEDTSCRADVSALSYHLEQGGYWRAVDAPTRALLHYNCVLLLDPDNSIGLLRRAEMLIQLNRYELAAPDLDRVLALDTHFAARVYTLRGDAHWQAGDQDAAVRAYDNALATDDTYAPAYLKRGLLVGIRGDDEGAIDHFETALALGYQPAYLPYRYIGEVHHAQERYIDAIAAYDAAIQLAPEEADLYRILAVSYDAIGDQFAALDAYHAYSERVRSVDPVIQARISDLTIRTILLRYMPIVGFIILVVLFLGRYLWTWWRSHRHPVVTAPQVQTRVPAPAPDNTPQVANWWWLIPIIGIVLWGLGQRRNQDDGIAGRR